MTNTLTLVALLMLSANLALGQTAADIELNYGKPTNVFSVSEHVWMAPEFGIDGQVCRVSLFPRRISRGMNYLSKELPFEAFEAVVDQLVPASTRGVKKDPFYGSTWATGGGAMWAIFTYQNVTLMYSAGFRVDPESWKKREPFVFSDKAMEFSVGDRKADPSEKPTDDFLPYRGSKVEIVTIQWSDRKCATK